MEIKEESVPLAKDVPQERQRAVPVAGEIVEAKKELPKEGAEQVPVKGDVLDISVPQGKDVPQEREVKDPVAQGMEEKKKELSDKNVYVGTEKGKTVDAPFPEGKDVAMEQENPAPAGGKENESPGDVEPEYFHQYFSDKKNTEFPPSVLVVQDKDDELLAMVKEGDGEGGSKLSFKKLDRIEEGLGYSDNGYELEIFTDKNMLSAAWHNFKAGYNQTNVVMDSAYIAIKRPMDNIRDWVSARMEVEKGDLKFSENEIPYTALERIGIKKEDLDVSQVKKLLKGESTDQLTVALQNKDVELKEVPPYTIRLERKDEKIVARLTFKKDYLDIEKDKIGKGLTKEQQIEVVRKGEVEIGPVPGSKEGEVTNVVIWDKVNNVLERREKGASPLKIKETAVTLGVDIKKEDGARLAQGSKIIVENAINPATEKRENLVLSFNGNKEMVSEPVLKKERDIERSKELKER